MIYRTPVLNGLAAVPEKLRSLDLGVLHGWHRRRPPRASLQDHDALQRTGGLQSLDQFTHQLLLVPRRGLLRLGIVLEKGLELVLRVTELRGMEFVCDREGGHCAAKPGPD